MVQRRGLAGVVGSSCRHARVRGIGKACAEALEGRVLLAVTVLSEDFEGNFPSDNGWSVGDSNGSGATAYWDRVDYGFGGEDTHTGNGMGYCAGVGYGNSSDAPTYQNYMTAYMSQSIDLTGLSSATLDFWYKIPSIESGYDYLRVYVGSTQLLSTSTARTSWTEASYDLSSYVGTSPTLRFEFYSDDSNTREGAYLDDISVTGNSGPSGQIEGDKWSDLDGDGVRDAGEPGLSGWTIYLDSDNDGVLDGGEPSQVTSASGHYIFSGLAAGTYRVREVIKSGWTQTYPGNTAQRLFEVRAEGTAATIYDVDPTTGAAINSFAAPAAIGFGGPQGLALGSNSLFYTDNSIPGPLTLWELNPNTGAVIDSDSIAPGTLMFAAGLGYLNGKVYIEASDTNQIFVWDPVTDTTVTTLNVAADLNDGLTGAGDRGVLYDSNLAGQIFKIDPATGGVLATFSPGVGPLFAGLAYVNGELIAANWETSGVVYRISPDTGAVLGTLTLGGTGGISALGGDGARAGTGVSGNGAHTVILASGQLVTGRDFGNLNGTPTNITLSNSAVAENQPVGTVVGTLSSTDPNVGDTFTYSLVSGAGSTDNGSFTISGNQLLTAASFNYEAKSTYSIRVRTTDQGGLWFEKVFTISVTNVNEVPTNLALSNSLVPEKQPVGTTVGTLSTTDPDAGNTFTYTLVSGTGSTDNSSFTITGSTLQTAAIFDLATKGSYSIRVRTTDQGGLWFEKAFTITVTAPNQAPTDITLSNSSIAENQASGTAVGALGTTDPDAGNTFIYSLVSGTGSTDNASFTISSGTLQTAAIFNYEVKNSYSIRVRSTDQGGLWFEKVFSISVTNVNETPTNITLSVSSIAENQPSGTAVGIFSSTDPDTGNTFTYTLVSGLGSTDNSSFTISSGTLQTAALFNYEVKNSYSIRVRSTDQGGLWFEKVFTISVTNVNETPTNITLSASSIAENMASGTAIGTLGTTDPDAGNTFTYSLVSGTGGTDNASVTISNSTLQTAASFNYETKNSYSIRIRSTDQGGLWFEKVFTINVTNVNEIGTDTTLSPSSVVENQPIGTIVGTFSTDDPDVGDTLTYALVSGTGADDNASFTIVGNTLLTAAVFNYATKSSYSIRVRTTDTGGLYFGRAVTITVTPAVINQAPTDISLSASSVAENQSTGTVVGALSSTDPDTGDTFTYSLVSGTGSNDNASFTISGSQFLTAASFDYEAKSSYSIRVRATDQGGLWLEKAFTINVTDVDEIAPAVTAVYVRGSTWNTNYLSFLAGNLVGSSATYGYAIPVGSGSAQLQTLPWRNLNRISLAFSEDVSIAQAQFAIVGSVGSYAVSGFSYSAADHVATWSLSAVIGPDKLYVAVPGSGSTPVKDAAGNVLDGEWNNPSSYSDAGPTDSFPSGNGSAGGDFAFRFDVLPGDSTGGSLGKVNVADIAQTKSRSGPPVSISSYRSDFDGNNLVNVADIAYVKSRSGLNSLPVNPPVLPAFGMVFSQVSLLQSRQHLLLG